jgi:hypothetical protein
MRLNPIDVEKRKKIKNKKNFPRPNEQSPHNVFLKTILCTWNYAASNGELLPSR